MQESIVERLQNQSIEDIVLELTILIYREPLSSLRDTLRTLPETIRVVFLVVYFDTEVNMGSMFGFLQNYTGRYLMETIEAFYIIGAVDTANILSTIRDDMIARGITWEKLRADLDTTQEYTITTFGELHGTAVTEALKDILQTENELYIYNEDGEQVYRLLADYLSLRKEELFQFVRQLESGIE
jgi:hypothetical protein